MVNLIYHGGLRLLHLLFFGLKSTSRMKEPDVVAERAAFASPSQDGVEVPAAVLFLAPEPRGVLWEKLRAKAGPVERGQPAPRALVQVPTEPKKAGVALAAPRFSIISAADCDEGRLCNTKCYSTLGKNTAALCGSAASAGSILQADSRPEPGLFNDSVRRGTWGRNQRHLQGGREMEQNERGSGFPAFIMIQTMEGLLCHHSASKRHSFEINIF